MPRGPQNRSALIPATCEICKAPFLATQRNQRVCWRQECRDADKKIQAAKYREEHGVPSSPHVHYLKVPCLSIKELEERWGVGQKTIKRWRRVGKIRAIRLHDGTGNHKAYFPLSDIERFEDTRLIQVTRYVLVND